MTYRQTVYCLSPSVVFRRSCNIYLYFKIRCYCRSSVSSSNDSEDRVSVATALTSHFADTDAGVSATNDHNNYEEASVYQQILKAPFTREPLILSAYMPAQDDCHRSRPRAPYFAWAVRRSVWTVLYNY